MNSLSGVLPSVRTLLVAAFLTTAAPAQEPEWRFRLQEATIADVHRAIRAGQITCRQLVQLYLNRARAYNGASDRLIAPSSCQ